MIRTGWMLLLLLPCLATAQGLYRWTDEQGRVHFSDRPREGDPAVEELQIKQQPLLGQDEAVQETWDRLQRLRDADSSSSRKNSCVVPKLSASASWKWRPSVKRQNAS